MCDVDRVNNPNFVGVLGFFGVQGHTEMYHLFFMHVVFQILIRNNFQQLIDNLMALMQNRF